MEYRSASSQSIKKINEARIKDHLDRTIKSISDGEDYSKYK